jgi:hypothetical protein
MITCRHVERECVEYSHVWTRRVCGYRVCVCVCVCASMWARRVCVCVCVCGHAWACVGASSMCECACACVKYGMREHVECVPVCGHRVCVRVSSLACAYRAPDLDDNMVSDAKRRGRAILGVMVVGRVRHSASWVRDSASWAGIVARHREPGPGIVTLRRGRRGTASCVSVGGIVCRHRVSASCVGIVCRHGRRPVAQLSSGTATLRQHARPAQEWHCHSATRRACSTKGNAQIQGPDGRSAKRQQKSQNRACKVANMKS